MSNSYSFTDFRDYEPGRGGPTTGWNFGVDGNTLEVSLELNDATTPNLSHGHVLSVLEARFAALQKETAELAAFLTEARKTTQVATEDHDPRD